MDEPILCYVDLPWAYFTTQPLAEQWGDDWNDAPYEHNAGRPYEWHEGFDDVRGKERWGILKVAFDDINLLTPNYGVMNSSYSVEAINAGAIPWLRHDDPRWTEHNVVIPAGTPLGEFIRLIHMTGGHVYMAVEG